MRFLRVFIFVIIGLAALVSCSNQPRHEATYRRVRAIMDSLPGEALAILDSIPTEELDSDLDSARYILLHATAENKTSSLVTSDSSMQYAIDIFKEHGIKSDLRFAYYLHGTVYMLKEKYADALVSLMEAENLIDSSTSPYEQGLIYSELAHCCNAAWNGELAISYIKKAYQCYEEAEKPLHAVYSLYDRGMFYTNANEHTEAIAIYNTVIPKADSLNFLDLKENALAGIGYSYIGLDDYRNAVKYFRQISDSAKIMDNQTIALMAQAEQQVGNNQKADSLAQILKQRGDYKWIYAADLNKISIDTLVDAYKEQEKFRGEEAYYAYHDRFPIIIENNFKLKEELIESRHKVQQLWIGILALLLIITIYLVYKAIKTYKRKLRKQQESYYVLSNDFLTFLRKYNKYYARLEEGQDGGLSSTKSLLYHHTRILNHAVETSSNDTPKTPLANKRLKDELDNLLKDLRGNTRVFEELKSMVNRENHDILLLFQDELPDLTEEDRRLFTYMVSGFSSHIMVKLYNMDTLAQYAAKKHRLKKKIMERDTPSQHLFLKYF